MSVLHVFNFSFLKICPDHYLILKEILIKSAEGCNRGKWVHTESDTSHKARQHRKAGKLWIDSKLRALLQEDGDDIDSDTSAVSMTINLDW